MTPPRFEPQPDNTFRIVHGPEYGAAIPLLRRIEAGELAPADAEARLKEALKKYPWQFEAAWTLSGLYTAGGEFRKACEVRFKACQHLMELLPDEEEAEPMPLDFGRKESEFPLLLLHGSAVDHFLIYEYEMAAALLETLLDLDEEDHLDASQTLAWCYVALNEPESFDAVLPDLDDKSAEKALAELWAELRFTNQLPAEKVLDFKKRFPAVFREFTGDSHEATEAYLADIDGERPSPEARARLVWLKTEHLWQQFLEFTVILKQYA